MWRAAVRRRRAVGIGVGGVASAAAAADDAADADAPDPAADGRWMIDASRLPERFVSAGLECVSIDDGKGRGLRANRAVAAGELLMLVPPLAALVGAPGSPPEPGDLVDAMLQAPAAGGAPAGDAAGDAASASTPSPSAPAPVDSPWMSLLYDGSTASARAAVDISHPLGGAAAAATAAAAEGSSGGGGGGGVAVVDAKSRKGNTKAGGFSAAAAASGSAKRERQQLKRRAAKAVAFNAFGDRHQDLALAALSREAKAAAAAAGGGQVVVGEQEQEEDASLVGLWPEFSMLNHSCAPNSINLPVHLAGGRPFMAVRAARAMAAGEEATISYVGAEQLRPLRERRAALKESFGFECGCLRCAAEAALYGNGTRIGATADAVAEATAEARPAFEAALKARDAAALRDARREAAADLATLYAELRGALVRPKPRLWLQASLYSTLELIADADEALCGGGVGGVGGGRGGGGGGGGGSDDAEAAVASAAAALNAVEAVSPGSDLHVQLAARHAAAARLLRDLVGRNSGGSGNSVHEAAAEQAERRCAAAHALRYGACGLPAETMERLIALSLSLGLGWMDVGGGGDGGGDGV